MYMLCHKIGIVLYCIVLYCILRNPLREVSSAYPKGRWSIFLPLYFIHGEVYCCADIQVRYITKQ